MNIRTTTTEHMKYMTAVMEVLRENDGLNEEPFVSMDDHKFENFISDVAGTVRQYLTEFNVDPGNTALVDYIICSELDSHVMWLDALLKDDTNTIKIIIEGIDHETGEVQRTNHIILDNDSESDDHMACRLARVMRAYRNNDYNISVRIER